VQLFQPADVLAHRRRGHAQGLGGGVHAAVFEHGGEGEQGFEVVHKGLLKQIFCLYRISAAFKHAYFKLKPGADAFQGAAFFGGEREAVLLCGELDIFDVFLPHDAADDFGQLVAAWGRVARKSSVRGRLNRQTTG
jgi:hypothetical protein